MKKSPFFAPQITYDESTLKVFELLETKEASISDNSAIYSKGNISNDFDEDLSTIQVTDEDRENFRKKFLI